MTNQELMDASYDWLDTIIGDVVIDEEVTQEQAVRGLHAAACLLLAKHRLKPIVRKRITGHAVLEDHEAPCHDPEYARQLVSDSLVDLPDTQIVRMAAIAQEQG